MKKKLTIKINIELKMITHLKFSSRGASNCNPTKFSDRHPRILILFVACISKMYSHLKNDIEKDFRSRSSVACFVFIILFCFAFFVYCHCIRNSSSTTACTIIYPLSGAKTYKIIYLIKIIKGYNTNWKWILIMCENKIWFNWRMATKRNYI